MKVLIAIVGAFVGAVLAVLFFSNFGAVWYTGDAEFQSPDEFEETYSTIYLAVLVASTMVGYLIGRVIGGRIDARTSDGDDA